MSALVKPWSIHEKDANHHGRLKEISHVTNKSSLVVTNASTGHPIISFVFPLA